MMLVLIDIYPGFGRCAARPFGGLLRFRLSSFDSPQSDLAIRLPRRAAVKLIAARIGATNPARRVL